jgi:hypothetical protein
MGFDALIAVVVSALGGGGVAWLAWFAHRD